MDELGCVKGKERVRQWVNRGRGKEMVGQWVKREGEGGTVGEEGKMGGGDSG